VIDTSTYDPCFLIIITNSAFGVVGMQTDDIIILGDECFLAREKQELIQANYTAKPKKKLLAVILLLFNRYILSLDRANMNLRQKGQANKLQIINSKSLDTPTTFCSFRPFARYLNNHNSKNISKDCIRILEICLPYTRPPFRIRNK
jgi:hypothetical protein